MGKMCSVVSCTKNATESLVQELDNGAVAFVPLCKEHYKQEAPESDSEL
jgi:hypothetical protein